MRTHQCEEPRWWCTRTLFLHIINWTGQSRGSRGWDGVMRLRRQAIGPRGRGYNRRVHCSWWTTTAYAVQTRWETVVRHLPHVQIYLKWSESNRSLDCICGKQKFVTVGPFLELWDQCIGCVTLVDSDIEMVARREGRKLPCSISVASHSVEETIGLASIY